jgi:hydroxymethylbilane synthase
VGKVGEGELEGSYWATPAWTRLGCVNAVTQVFELDEMLPAPGQGALAVECRDGEPRLAALLGAVCDLASLAAVTAERSLLEALQAGCRAPIAAYATGTGQLRMQAAVMTTDGRRTLRAHGAASSADARQLGRDLAEQLLGARASDLIGAHPDRLNSLVGDGNANR